MQKRLFPLVILILIGTAVQSFATIRYVKANVVGGTSDGLSWLNAYNNLQAALAVAVPGDEIWVAQGMYYPDEGPGQTNNDRNAYFSMKDGVIIYGGFPATGNPTLIDRNWKINVTTLSGEIQQNNDATDNTYNIIYNFFNSLTSTAVLDGFTIKGGNADGSTYRTYGGGGVHNRNSSPAFTNCTFTENSVSHNTSSVDGSGGAMFNEEASPTITNCIFSQNTSVYSAGGAINNINCPPVTLINCVFWNNTSRIPGSAIYNNHSGSSLTNCSFSKNSGLPIQNTNTSTAGITNCIFWGNGTSSFSGASGFNITYSIVEGGYSGNLSINPLFVNADNADLRLLPCSPAINAGTNTNAPTTDILGNTRVGTTDMGAYEYQSTPSPTTFSVNDLGDLPDINPGDGVCATSGGTCTLRAAIMETNALPACSPLTINFSVTGIIDLSTALPNLNHPNLTITGPGASNLTVRRSLTGGTPNFSIFIVNSGKVFNLSGLKITNGNASFTGGALANNGGTTTVNDCEFSNNASTRDGGALTNQNGTLNVTKSIIKDNTAATYGGGLLNISNGAATTTTLTNCLISGNTAPGGGTAGGVDNTAQNGSSTVNLVNCTVTLNNGSGGGSFGGLGSFNAGAVITLKNTIIAGNIGTQAGGNGTITSLGNNLSSDGTGNLIASGDKLNTDPLFVSTTDFQLQPCSPAINAGTNTGAPATDILGNARVGTTDMGAYEYQGNPLVSTINAPTITQPTCPTPTGSIVVNATGNGTLEYSINNGSNWQTNATFSSLSAGNYTIQVRFQASPACINTYVGNPVILTPFSATAIDTWTGCVSTDWATPANWQDGTVPTATDDVTIPNVTNDPIIGAAAVAKSVTVQNGAVLTNNSTLTINGSSTQGMLNNGTLHNNGTLAIGNMSGVGQYGLYNQAIFNNNNNGHLTIDRAISDGLVNDNSGTVTNLGTIDIGGVETVGSHGIRNQANFNNNAGQININRAGRGLLHQIGTFKNAAGITIGGIGGIGDLGLLNLTTGTFNNNSGGQIKIDNSTFAGIINQGTTFNNAGMLTIGSVAAVGAYGLQNNSNGTFNNNAGGEINIDRSTTTGLDINSGSFTNLAKITIGAAGSVGTSGINNTGTFANNGCRSLINIVSNNIISNTGTFTNEGIIIENASGNSSITGNTGVVQNLNGGTFNIGTNTGVLTTATGDIWIGCTSTDWATADNWLDGTVPTATDDVTIPNVTNDPIIAGGTAAVAKSLVVQAGTVFTINTTGSLTINGSTVHGLDNYGTLDNSGTIRMGNTTAIVATGIVHRNGGTLNNKTGGAIYIDQTGEGGIYTSGIVNNEATIEIGSNTAVNGLGLYIESGTGTFNNKAGSLLTINRSTVWGMENKGTLDNSGTIRIGNIASVGSICIVHRSGGTFNNKTGGLIYMDRTTAGGQAFYSQGAVNNKGTINIGSIAILNGEGIRIGGGTFDNEALIEIGSNSDVKSHGIYNSGTFNNKVGGDIRINRIGIYGNTVLCIMNFGTFNNDAKITIGNMGLVYAQDGIYNAGSFTNNAAGVISIAKPWGNGIWNVSGTFQNAGQITISNVINSTGILSTAPFTNTANAQIHIDQVGNGIATTKAFTNSGIIRMGENAPLTGTGIANIQGVNAVFNNNAGGDISIKQTAADGVQNDVNSTFNNNACAKLTILDNLNNAGTFSNAGLFTVNTTQAHTNSALTNNGIIEYPQGNPIPNVTNNDLIANSVSGCVATVTSALQIGGMNSFTVGTTWYKDQALTQSAGTYDQNTNTFTANGLATGNTYQLYFSITDQVNMCARTVSIPVTLNPLPTASILTNNNPICTSGNAAFTVSGTNGATLTYTLTGLVGNQTLLLDGSNQTITVYNATNDITLTLVSVTKNNCPMMLSATATVRINAKPTITLSVNGQTLNEGNNSALCDTDANPVNPLQFTVAGACISGSPVWRVQIGNGAWSNWSNQALVTQSSDNQTYRYQAACDGNCPSTYTGPIELTINYRASTPQNVSLVADGTTIAAGESKTICNLEGNTLTFNATCAAGEIVLYSVDGGDYSTTVPAQIVDNNFHNYRVRCRKADNAPSCGETESAVMSLKITTAGQAPTVSITPLSSCGTPAAFTGNSNCGALTTIWYNATTNQALPTLPTTTPNTTTSFYARCQNEAGCLSENSNTVTFTITPVNDPPVITASADIVCTGTQVTIAANCPAGSSTFWNTGVTTNSFQVAFSNVTQQIYWAKCIFPNGCQSSESIHKTIFWKAFELTFINIGQSQSATKPANDRNLWTAQFIAKDAGPVLENSTEANPTIYYSENVNKTAPRFWTIQTETCNLGTDGSVTYDLLAAPEVGVVRSYNTHENNAPYLMYANREGFTELYAQNHPAYGFYQDNGSGGNVYDAGLPKGLYKLGIRYWDQKGQGSIYPSTRQPAGNVLAYQEYWFRIQSQNGVGAGAARVSGLEVTGLQFAQVAPNPVSNILHLKVSDAKGQKVNVSLVDASGRTLLQRAFVPETHQHQEEFEVSNLTNGMYFLQVQTTDKQATLKVVKVQ